MKEITLRKLSCIDNLLGLSWGRFVLGIIFILYGILIFGFVIIEDFWIKLSIFVAFVALGLMFILDGQSILREFFRDKGEIFVQENKFQKKESKKINKSKLKINLLGIYLFLILIAFIFISIKTYFNYSENNLIFSLILIGCSGGIGGTLYSIRGFYQNLGEGNFNFNNWVWWYIFRPIMSVVIGVFVYFLIVGGLLSIGNVSDINYSKGLMFYCALAFLAGFSFTQFANKLEELASTIFTKKENKKK